MPPKNKRDTCSVFGCLKNHNLKHHSFPKCPKIRKLWAKACNQTGSINFERARICQRHFSDNQIKRNLKFELLGIPPPTNYRNLKIDAIPDLCLPDQTDKNNTDSEEIHIEDSNQMNSPDELPDENMSSAEGELFFGSSDEIMPETVDIKPDISALISNIENTNQMDSLEELPEGKIAPRNKRDTCSIFGCLKNHNLKHHSFPKCPKIRKLWAKACNQTGSINFERARICQRHFSDNQIKRNLKFELLGIPPPTNYRNLKIDAIPDLCLPDQTDTLNIEVTDRMDSPDEFPEANMSSAEGELLGDSSDDIIHVAVDIKPDISALISNIENPVQMGSLDQLPETLDIKPNISALATNLKNPIQTDSSDDLPEAKTSSAPGEIIFDPSNETNPFQFVMPETVDIKPDISTLNRDNESSLQQKSPLIIYTDDIKPETSALPGTSHFNNYNILNPINEHTNELILQDHKKNNMNFHNTPQLSSVPFTKKKQTLNLKSSNKKSNDGSNSKNVEADTSFSCKVCIKSFNTKRKLKNHMLTHSEIKAFKCDICSKGFTQKKLLSAHIVLHSGEKPFSCEICSKNFVRKDHLNAHVITHTGEKPFRCNVCGKMFNRKGHLQTHLVLHTGEKPFNCNFCDKTFSQKSQLDSHIRMHTGEKPFCCEICGKQFNIKSNLKAHILLHKGEKPFNCEICNKTFSQRGQLTRHVSIHSEEKPFGCQFCNKKFTVKDYLNQHISVHTGEKPFGCDVCEKMFSRKGDLNRHYLLHTQKKPFKCEFCDKEFTLKKSLDHHIFVHTEEKPFNCEICGRKYIHQFKFEKHVLSHSVKV